MDRAQFEALRDLGEKTIAGDIRFSRPSALAPLLVAEGIRVSHAGSVQLIMTIKYNPEAGSKSINLLVPVLGPFCRLDVDGPPPRPAGRSHKHALHTERCPARNLPIDVSDRPELAGRSVREVFDAFCEMAGITHHGEFEVP